ncbi:NUDIX hydrolase [Trueperella bernardiae]|uniref:NUDIX hydrolase n=1 Tax=Trueperella bernardiae TaxID=59561 RepID=UPI002044B5C0|nr:CoA pyrophosphatase [Trueperella bernardiae]MCM3907852.1 CoA pyrophosphatase [Trueperella bernardiae]
MPVGRLAGMPGEAGREPGRKPGDAIVQARGRELGRAAGREILTAGRLRSALAAELDPIVDAGHPLPGKGMRRAAVLILLDAADDPAVLLTQRAAHMRKHAGQVSFPGGSMDPGESEVQAALREAWEECAIPGEGVQVWGQLPASSLPVTSFSVTPVVGVWDSALTLEPVASPAEVEAIHLVKVADLAAPANRGSWHRAAAGREYGGAAFQVGDLVIWGFTAMLLDGLLVVAGWSRPWDTERRIAVPRRFGGWD